MNRRAFLGRVGVGLVGACLATKVSSAWLPAPVKSWAACEFLRREVNNWFARYGIDHPPKVIVADAALYDAFRSELTANQRFTAGPRFRENEGCLVFKGIPVRRSAMASDTGWRAVLVAGEREEAA